LDGLAVLPADLHQGKTNFNQDLKLGPHPLNNNSNNFNPDLNLDHSLNSMLDLSHSHSSSSLMLGLSRPKGSQNNLDDQLRNLNKLSSLNLQLLCY